MFSPVCYHAMYCGLQHGFDISSIFTLEFSSGNVIWSHYQSNVPAELKAQVDVLKDMLMFREEGRWHIFASVETATVI